MDSQTEESHHGRPRVPVSPAGARGAGRPGEGVEHVAAEDFREAVRGAEEQEHQEGRAREVQLCGEDGGRAVRRHEPAGIPALNNT